MTPGLFINHCANSGLQLARTNSLEDFNTIALLALHYGFNFNENKGILVGYDFHCLKKSGCKGEWFSLDGTTNLKQIATVFNKQLSKEFTGIKGNEALLLQNGILKTVTFSESHINSLVCTTPFEFKFKDIGCAVTFTDIAVMDVDFVACPEICKKEKFKAYGEVL